LRDTIYQIYKDQIVEAGLNLLVSLITGIVQAIPQLVDMLPAIITTIITVIIHGLYKCWDCLRDTIYQIYKDHCTFTDNGW